MSIFQKPRLCGAFSVFRKSYVSGVTAAIFLSPSIAQASDNDWAVFTEVNSQTYSESFTLWGLSEGIDESIFTEGGEASFTHNEFSIGARKGKWELAAFTRYDYLAKYSPDTAFLTYADSTDIEVPNADYDVDLKLDHSWNYGLRLGYTVDVSPTLQAQFRLSGILATDIVDGRANGTVSLTDRELSEGVLDVDYRFTQDLLFLREIDDTQGYGLSLDAIVHWQATDKLNFEVAAFDAFNRIWWNDVPGTQADATTNVLRTDENGIFIVRPILQGKNISGPYGQILKARFKARADYKIADRWGVSQEIFATNGSYLTETGLHFKPSKRTHIGTTYEWESGAVGAELGWRGIRLGFATDSTKWKKARYAKLHIGIVQSF